MKSMPPMLPTILLERLLAGSEPIVGDLVEEFGNGRSRSWYWKQALGAMAVGIRDEILDNKLLAIRAVATGWSFLLLFSLLLWSQSLELVGSLMPIEWHVFLWVHPPGMQVLLATMSGLVYLGSGWLVARLHRAHQVAMLFVYVVSLALWRFPGFSDLIVGHDRPVYFYSLVISVLVLLVNVACIALGGLLEGSGGGMRRKRKQDEKAKQLSKTDSGLPLSEPDPTSRFPQTILSSEESAC